MAKTTSQKTKTSTSSSALQKLQNANNEAKKKLQTKAKTQKTAVSNLKKANAEAKKKLQAIAEEESKSKKNKLSALDKVNAKINELEGKEVISTKYKIGELKPSQKLREKTQQNKELLTKINTAIDKLKSGDYNKTTSAFEDYVNNSGYGNQFSKADIMLGSKDPYAGAGLLAAKQRYNNATSQAEKDAAHAQAEAIRNNFLYSGGTEGGEFKPVSTDSMTLKSKTNQLKYANQEPAKTEAQQMKEKSDKVNSDLMAFGEDSLKTTKELEEELKAINQRLAILGTKNGNVSSIRGAAGSTINADAERAQLIAQKQSINNHIELLKQQEGYNTYFQYEKNRNNPDFESTVKKFNATDDDKKKGIVTSYLNMMTSDEKEMFKYLYVKNGADSAYKYVEFITSDFNAEKRMNQLVQNYQREGAENPVKASVSSILSSPLKGISYVGQAADYLADGKMKDNAWYNTFTNYSTALRDGVSTTVEKNFGTKGSFLYQVGMSLGDFLVAAGLNPSAAVGILGTAAAADMTVSAKKRGLSDNQAISLGTLAGVAETIFEKVSLDALIKPNLGKEAVSKFLLKNIAIEGSEEAATEIANTFSDIIVSRDQSLWSQDVQSYIDKGYSRKEAEKQAFYDLLKGVGLAALGGALAGGVLSGGRVSLNKLSDVVAKTNNTIQTNYQNKLDKEYQNKIKNDETAAQSLGKDNKTKNQTVLPKYGESVEAKADNTVTAQSETKAQEETKEAPAIRQEVKKQTELVNGRYDDTKDAIPELSKTDKMTARDLVGKVYRTKSLQQASELFDNLKEKAETEGDLQTAVAINTINNQLKEGKAVDPEKVIALADNINNAEKNAIIDMFSQTAPVQAAANTTAGNLNQEPVQTTETQTEDNNKFNFNTSVTELNRQLDAGEITQDEYDEAYDYLIQEEDIEGGSMLFPDTKLSLSDNVKEKLQSMTPAEKEAVVKRISDAIGVNIESYRQKYGANGMYYGGQIRANTASDKSIEFIISHELTHLIENSGHYNTIKDVAMAAMGTDFFDEVSRVKELYNGKYNRNLTDEQIEQEVVADFVGNELLTNERQITELAKNNRTVAERILAWLDRTVSRLTGDEAAVFRSMYDGARRIYAKALSEAKDEVGRIEFGDVDKVFAGQLAEVDNGVIVRESQRSWDETNKQNLKNRLKKVVDEEGNRVYSDQQIDRWINSVNRVSAMILANKDTLNYVPNRNETMLKPNAEYGYTLEASTLCSKRLLFQGTLNAIMKRIPNEVLLSDDIIHLTNLLKEHGYESPCSVCYVESRRRLLGQYTLDFLDTYKGEYIPTYEELMSTEGLNRLQEEHPRAYKDYVTSMNAKGVNNPKLVQLRTDYREEIKKFQKSTVERLNRDGGLRLQSFSDFEIYHAIDVMQALIDMAQKGLTSHAYTKVPEFALIFGNSGIKINLSLIPKGDGFDEDGNLAFDGIEGMDYKTALKLRKKYSKNVGTIAIGISDKHIKALMADPNIDFIIPFHKSGWGEKEMEALGIGHYKSYESTQTESWIDPEAHENEDKPKVNRNDYWIDNHSGKINAQHYLDYCAKKGIRPVFYEFLKDNGDGSYSLPKAENGGAGSADGFWKMLIDFKMYDNSGRPAPQQVVTPRVNMTQLKKAYKNVIEGKTVYGQDSEIMKNVVGGGSNNLPVATDVVDEMVDGIKSRSKEDLNEKIAEIRKNRLEKFNELDKKYAKAIEDYKNALEAGYEDDIRKSADKLRNMVDSRIKAASRLGRDFNTAALSELSTIEDASGMKADDLITYDGNGNVIPLSQRFDLDNPDVRFSISDTKQNADSNNSEKYVPDYANKVDNGYEVTIKTLSGKTRTETIKGRTYNSGTDWTKRDWDLWKRTIESEWTDKTTANGRIEAEQYIYAPYQKGVANENNFMWSTLALFESVSYRPKRKPDYVSYGRNGKVSSEYWYTKDGVIRGSNHWGENIATCDWGLKGKNGSDLMKTNKLYGFAPWNEFVQKSRKINTYTGHNLGFTDFENTIGKGKVRINGKNYEYDKYDGLWDDYDSDVRFSISEEGNVYDRFPKKAQDYVRRIMNGVKTSAINSFDIKPGHKNEAKDILDELRDEYLNNGCVMREGRKLEYIDRILVNSKLSEEAKAVMTVEFGNALDDGLSLLNQAIKYSAEYYGKRGAETGAETGAEQEQGEELSYFDQVIQSYLDDYGFRDVGSDASTNINPNAGEIAVERVVAQNRQKALDRDRIINMNLSELGDKYTELKKAKRKIDRISQKNLLTDDDRAILDGLMRGEVAEEYIDAAKYNKKAIVELFKAKQEREAIVKEIKLWNWARRKAIRDEVQEILDGATIKKEKKAGYLYARETMERNTEDVFDKETAKRINDFIFKPVHKSVKASMDYKKQMRERVMALNISQKIASGNEMSEAYVVQALGEAQANIKIMNRSRGTITWRQGKTLEEWTEMVSEIYAANPNMDFEKIQNCINEFQKIYDELFQNMNESRLRNGYEPVNYLQGYFPHFSENEEGLLGKFAKAVGIKLDVNALPTAINGMTHVFRPGIRWFANANERLGFNTAYDCIQGFDSYIEGCSDVIHLTDAIQRLRAFSTQIRWNSSDEGMKRQMQQIQDRQDISEEEKEDMIRKLFEEGKYELSGYVANLDEYTNLLANKKSKYDRNMEALFNRKFYSLAQKFESRVAANMIVPNVGSWLTNFIPITQAWAQVGSHNLLHGMLSTVGNVTKPDGLKEASVFLSTRDGSRPIVRTKAEKAADVVGRPMMWIDEFTCGAIFRGRYYQELRRGMSEAEAMDVADDFTRRVISGRTKGSMPILFEARNPIFKMMTQFQLEVNNEFSYLFKDIPREGKEKGLAYIGMMIFKFCLGAWLYDELYYWLIGRKPALDPIDIVNNTVGDITGYHIPSIEDIINGIKDGDGINFATERKENPLDIVKGTAEKILDRIPIVGSIGKSMMGLESGGRYPVFNALPTWSDFETYLDKDVSKEKKLDTLYKYGLKLGAYTAFPFGGGEVKKVIETIRGGLEGGSYSVNKEGKKQLQYPMFVGDNLKDNILEGARSVLFGKTTLPTAREWINNDFNTYSPQLTEAYKFMIDNGEKRKSAFSALKQVNELDVSGMTSTEKAQALSQLISGFDIGKTSKMVLYAGKVANEDESTAIFNLIDSGVDENVLADVVNEIFSAYSEGLTGNEKKAAIRSAIDSAGLNEDQTFELYKGFINTGYDDYVEQFMEAGITQSQAESAAKAIVMLKPRSGSDTVSYIDKYLAILGSGKYSATQQFELLQGQSYWDGYEYKVQAAYDVAGVTPEMFAKMQAQKFELGVGSSGSMNKEQLKKAVDAVGNEMSLTTSQKAALWQTYSLASGFKSKNNPYSTSVGAEVEAAMRSGNTTKITNKDVENFNGTKNFSLEDMRCTDGSLEVTKGLVNQANKIQQLRDELGTELTVNSWYRSPSYNSTVEGAARNSFHTKGMATDIKIPSGANAKQWVANASAIWHELNGGAGGVIYYAKKGFVHFDSRDTRFDGVS